MQSLCKEFCKNSSVHGLQLLVSNKKSPKERVFWGGLFAVTFLLVSGYTCYLLHLLSHSSVEVIIDNPSYSLENIDFPAVTVCPNSKLMRSRLHRFLASWKNMTAEEIEKFENTMIALDLMNYPFYHLPNYFIKELNHSAYPLPTTDIFSTMMKVRPQLSDTIENCKWRGRSFSCKQLFRKQVTEEGLCFSFNSKTAERSVEYSYKVPPMETSDGSLQCLRNNAGGRGSGLTFHLRSLEHELLKESMIETGYSIMVHDPSGYPDVPHKISVFWKNWTYSRFSVLVSTVKADASLQRITKQDRGCQLDSNVSVNSCFFKCRRSEILRRCKCLPYFMNMKNRKVETCGVQHLGCLAANNIRLRNPIGAEEKSSFPDWRLTPTMECECINPCSYTTYEVEVTEVPAEEMTGYIGKSRPLCVVEVIYKRNFATSYIKKAQFSAEDFLVDVGGVASLFLGCSVLTLVELIIFVGKLTYQAYVVIFVRSSVVYPFVE